MHHRTGKTADGPGRRRRVGIIGVGLGANRFEGLRCLAQRKQSHVGGNPDETVSRCGAPADNRGRERAVRITVRQSVAGLIDEVPARLGRDPW